MKFNILEMSKRDTGGSRDTGRCRDTMEAASFILPIGYIIAKYLNNNLNTYFTAFGVIISKL